MLEAFRNEDIHPVPVKSIEQQILVTLHRLRSSWLAERTAPCRQLRRRSELSALDFPSDDQLTPTLQCNSSDGSTGKTGAP
ncbi:MAG: hypothetical protein HY270_03060 [Deltaproteobacteria bacterium]|nr:hypothetical protein [Deltaproteobacteria bacterium]